MGSISTSSKVSLDDLSRLISAGLVHASLVNGNIVWAMAYIGQPYLEDITVLPRTDHHACSLLLHQLSWCLFQLVVTVVKKESRSILFAKASHKASPDSKCGEIVSTHDGNSYQATLHCKGCANREVQRVETICVICVLTLSIWSSSTPILGISVNYDVLPFAS